MQKLSVLSLLLVASGLPGVAHAETVFISIPSNATPRVQFGAERLVEVLAAEEHEPTIVRGEAAGGSGHRIVVTTDGDADKEGFSLATGADETITVAGSDDSGALYGCLELAELIRETGDLPSELNVTDAPVFKLRGPCIGMQKTYILPGRKTYEYPYTPELFPWFYDKELWLDYLDILVETRQNTLYLWNGHPFASLVKLKDYPFAVEVPDDVFTKNVDMFHWLTAECDKRGIWLVQMFYSLLVSEPFAEHYGIETQLSEPTPEALDYTRKSIAQFVTDYPNVGLLVCLGEALVDNTHQTFLLTNSILGGVKEGMAAAGLKEQPPVVVRAHATDPYTIMPAALTVYSNIYTMAKYNGESLTTTEPRGEWQKRNLMMSQLTSNHVVNVHILANLEPFRYNAQRFIRKSVQASRDRFGGTGIHLYPLFYWDWPVSPDISDPRLKQWDRDWMWFESWARYEWNPDIPEVEDRAYWIGRLTDVYGNAEAAEKILDAGNDAGECAPRLLRRFGITEGNRQTLSLGMPLDALVTPRKYRPWRGLWEWQSPPGERLDVFVEKEWNNEAHEGETPVSIIRETLQFSQMAVADVDAAAPLVTKNRAEFERFRNDVHCIRAMTECYAEKVKAAMHVLRFQYSQDMADMEKAVEPLEASLDAFMRLTALTEKTYYAANSLQTGHRKVPFRGAIDGISTNYHWVHVLPLYEKELADFKAQVAELKQTTLAVPQSGAGIEAWPAATIRIVSQNAETYEVKVGAKTWTDRGYTITELAPELNGLTGIRFSHEAAKNGRYEAVEFEVSEPVRVLVGYFQEERDLWLQVPNTDFAAHADDRGGIDVVLRNAASIEGSPNVNIHAFRYEPGRHKLEMIGTGSFVVLGVVPQSAELEARDARKEMRQ